MRLIAGLGNPGRRYEQTRHNVGFLVVDQLARRWATDLSKYDRDFEALIGEAQRGDQRVLLLKPQTYMNLSGRSVLAAQRFYKIEPDSLLIVHDDLDLPPGHLRFRASGAGGGHRGLENVLLRLGSIDVPRLRIGIGKVDRGVAVDYVLSRFSPEEREDFEHAVQTAADAAECWLVGGPAAVMNRYNTRKRKEPREPDDAADGQEGERS